MTTPRRARDRLSAGTPGWPGIRSRTGHALLLMAVLAPMPTGTVVRTFAWMTLLSDKGVINQTLISLGVISQPLKLMLQRDRHRWSSSSTSTSGSWC